MTKQQAAALAFNKRFVKRAYKPPGYESTDREIVVVFDPYFSENFDLSVANQTWGFSNTEAVGVQLANHIRKEAL